MNPSATPSAARGVHVTPRLPEFKFDPQLDVTGWFASDLGRTAAWSALSVIASEGELGFIDAGRWLVARMHDPAIADETQRFIQQEAFHGTVHARPNRHLQQAGLPVAETRALVSDLLRGIEAHGGRSAFLAAMLAVSRSSARSATPRSPSPARSTTFQSRWPPSGAGTSTRRSSIRQPSTTAGRICTA